MVGSNAHLAINRAAFIEIEDDLLLITGFKFAMTGMEIRIDAVNGCRPAHRTLSVRGKCQGKRTTITIVLLAVVFNIEMIGCYHKVATGYRAGSRRSGDSWGRSDNDGWSWGRGWLNSPYISRIFGRTRRSPEGKNLRKDQGKDNAKGKNAYQ